MFVSVIDLVISREKSSPSAPDFVTQQFEGREGERSLHSKTGITATARQLTRSFGFAANPEECEDDEGRGE